MKNITEEIDYSVQESVKLNMRECLSNLNSRKVGYIRRRTVDRVWQRINRNVRFLVERSIRSR